MASPTNAPAHLLVRLSSFSSASARSSGTSAGAAGVASGGDAPWLEEAQFAEAIPHAMYLSAGSAGNAGAWTTLAATGSGSAPEDIPPVMRMQYPGFLRMLHLFNLSDIVRQDDETYDVVASTAAPSAATSWAQGGVQAAALSARTAAGASTAEGAAATPPATGVESPARRPGLRLRKAVTAVVAVGGVSPTPRKDAATAGAAVVPTPTNLSTMAAKAASSAATAGKPVHTNAKEAGLSAVSAFSTAQMRTHATEQHACAFCGESLPPVPFFVREQAANARRAEASVHTEEESFQIRVMSHAPKSSSAASGASRAHQGAARRFSFLLASAHDAAPDGSGASGAHAAVPGSGTAAGVASAAASEHSSSFLHSLGLRMDNMLSFQEIERRLALMLLTNKCDVCNKWQTYAHTARGLTQIARAFGSVAVSTIVRPGSRPSSQLPSARTTRVTASVGAG
ncbi:MAG: hypothetical protein EOO41_04050, partial [Methanobacteriota archaeon]